MKQRHVKPRELQLRSRAPLLVLYGTKPGCAMKELMDAMLTTAPPPPESRIAATARFSAKAYLRRLSGRVKDTEVGCLKLLLNLLRQVDAACGRNAFGG